MCLLVVVSRLIPGWPLVVAANRDERYERPSAGVASLRPRPPRTIGGRDLRAGGTWLAVNEHGVVAGLTNRPAPQGLPAGKRSRGEIPLALTEASSARTAVADFAAASPPGEFNPCWVLVGDRNALYYIDLTQPQRVEPRELGPGIHVLENKPFGEPSAKVQRVAAMLDGLGALGVDEVVERLRQVLRDHTLTLTGVEGDAEAQRLVQVSSCCVHTEDYGTRSAMLIRTPSSPAEPPQVWAADGPSCEHALNETSFAPQP